MRLTCFHRPRGEDGFTLIELLITIVIMGVITLPLSNLVLDYFQSTAQTTARLNESHDAQIAAAYFAQDVASVGTRDQATQSLNQSVWTDSFAGAPYACGTGTPVLLLAWDRFASSGGTPTTVEVAYLTQDGGTALVRASCPGPSGGSTSAVLAHNLVAEPEVGCPGDPSACGDSPGVPVTITMTLTIKDTTDSGSPYLITLTGQRMQT